jgi:hypothetical protein
MVSILFFLFFFLFRFIVLCFFFLAATCKPPFLSEGSHLTSWKMMATNC